MTRPSPFPARRATPFVVDRATLRLLLLPQPLLSTAYLLAVHVRLIQARFLPLLILAVFPLMTATLAVAGLRREGYSRRRNWAILEISVVELISALLLLVALGLGP